MLSLHNTMRANASSCIAFGFLFAIKPSLVATFLGGASPAPQWIFLALGIALIFNGLHLLWASYTRMPNKELVLYFSAGDYLWVIASVGLMLSGVWITTTGGVVAASAVAAMVGLFGILQMTSRKAMGHC